MTSAGANHRAGAEGQGGAGEPPDVSASRDLAGLPAAELVGTHAVDLMTAAAVKIGLYEGTEPDLAEARILIDALAGLVEAAAPSLGHHHALPLREGVRSLQVAFREAQEIPDLPGEGPGEGVLRGGRGSRAR
jgi:hypothetical protein